MSKFSIIILAAGASTRLGRPKQLLEYSGTTLIGYAAQTALAANENVVVVTGAVHDELLPALDASKVKIAHNTHWQEGMASSIICGLEAVKNDEPDAVLIMLCDQPLITSEHLKNLCATFAGTEDGPIVATAYNEITGVPAVFPEKYFSQLKALRGEQGARELLKTHQNSIIAVPFDPASMDIDTMEDYEKLDK